MTAVTMPVVTASRARAESIVAVLTGAGVRASTDPAGVTPPCILVPPPNRTFDLACGYTARWGLVALAPTASGTDRRAWSDLDVLIEAARSAGLPLEDAQLVTYNLAGVDYPAYLLSWSEAIA